MGATRDLSIATLDPLHDRKSFTCGTESLDRYLKTQASQDQRRKANGVFVMTAHEAPERVLGFYTLCATALSQGEVPESAKKLVPRYPLVSATLIGRLAVATERQGKGLGGILLTDALRRAYASAGTVGSSMIVVDALDERAIAFYAGRLGLDLRLDRYPCGGSSATVAVGQRTSITVYCIGK